MSEWLVFLCYRQVDGVTTAEWLHRILKGQRLEGYRETFEEPPTLVVYLDVAAPAVSDWHQLHGRALERARAFLVICTPGAFANLGPDDWVHKEVDWWLENRKTAPILIDATGQSHRWVPEKIRQRWPNAQLVKVDVQAWGALPEPEREAVLKITRDRILDGISASEQSVRLEDLNKHMARAFVERAERAVADGEELTADVLLAHAFELDRSVDIRDHFLAHIYLKFGDAHLAKPHLERLLIYQQDQARKYLTRPAMVDRLALASTTRAALDSWLILTAKLGELAYDSVLSSKGLVGRASLVERRIWRQVGREQPQVFRAFQHARQQLSGLHVDPTLSDWRARYDAAIGDLLEARAALNARAGKHEAAYRSWLSPTISDVQGRLVRSEVVLDFLRYANRYSVWIVGRHGVSRIELGPAGPIDNLLRECRVQIEQRDARYLATGGRLFDLIWAPIESHLADAETVYVVPDGDLVDFPLSALPNSRDSGFVIDRWKVAYLLSPQQILPWPEPAPLCQGALFVGVSETARSLHDGRGLGLPGAKLEVQAVASMYPNASVLFGECATERALRDAVSGARMLHIAAHGLPMPVIDMRAVLLGVSMDPSREIHKLVEGSDPLLKSGVALYDRIVTALELSDLDLDGVDLAVLSTQPEGAIAWSREGTFGLARALVEAGACTVVSTSSPVDDLTTFECMTTFHRRLLEGLSVVDALRQAALTIRSANPHPYYWAHFTVHGQARTLPS
jgi:CHAT domain-containing protein